MSKWTTEGLFDWLHTYLDRAKNVTKELEERMASHSAGEAQPFSHGLERDGVCIGCGKRVEDHPPGPPCSPIPIGMSQADYLRSKADTEEGAPCTSVMHLPNARLNCGLIVAHSGEHIFFRTSWTDEAAEKAWSLYGSVPDASGGAVRGALERLVDFMEQDSRTKHLNVVVEARAALRGNPVHFESSRPAASVPKTSDDFTARLVAAAQEVLDAHHERVERTEPELCDDPKPFSELEDVLASLDSASEERA